MDKFDTTTIHLPSELYAELVDIMTAAGLDCEVTTVINSQWGWRGDTAVTVQQFRHLVRVEFEDWVIDRLMFDCEIDHACPTIFYGNNRDFGLLCMHLVAAFLGYNEVVSEDAA